MSAEFMIATMAVSQAAKMGSEVSAAKSAKQAIDLRQKQNNLQIEQERLKTADSLQKVTSKQIAQGTVKGIDLSSPSFNAIQRDSFNEAQKDFKNLTIEQNLLDASSKIEKSNVSTKLWSQLFGDVSSTAMSFAKYKGA